jgi:hypothetical protein
MCHRDLWEPCLRCRQTGLQGPGIVWCPECRQPGRGERCEKCGAKLHAPPLCTKCGGLGWLPVHHACLPETHTGSIAALQQQKPPTRPPYGPGRTSSQGPIGPPVGHTHPEVVSPASAIPLDVDDEAEPSRRVGILRAIFIIILILLFVGYASCYWWAWF